MGRARMQGLRQIVAGRAAPPAAQTGRAAQLASAASAWATALQRAAAGQLGLDLAVTGIRGTEGTALDLTDRLPEGAMLLRLEADRGGPGVLALAPDLAAACVECLTLGRSGPDRAPPRRPTRTDAAMLAEAVDAALAAMPSEAAFCSAGLVAEARSLPLVLDDGPLFMLSLEAEVRGLPRGGPVLLALPAPPVPVEDQAAPADTAAFAQDLAAQVGAAQARLDAVIARLRLPLAEVLALAPGDWLRLGTAALDRIDLQGADGVRRAGGRLGQNRGMRAVRLGEAQPAGRSSAPRLAAAPSAPAPAAAPAPAPPDQKLRSTGT